MLIDTHSHLFLEEFSDDLPQVMERARQAGVSRIYMPNIDSTTIESMLSVCADYPDFCYPMIGLHPTSVNESYRQELSIVRERLEAPNNFVAIGEIGLDLYWDKTFLNEQLYVFEKQIEWALEYKLPIVVHSREVFDYIYKVMELSLIHILDSTFRSKVGSISFSLSIRCELAFTFRHSSKSIFPFELFFPLTKKIRSCVAANSLRLGIRLATCRQIVS